MARNGPLGRVRVLGGSAAKAGRPVSSNTAARAVLRETLMIPPTGIRDPTERNIASPAKGSLRDEPFEADVRIYDGDQSAPSMIRTGFCIPKCRVTIETGHGILASMSRRFPVSAGFGPAPPGIEIPGYPRTSPPGLSPGQGRPPVARDFNPGRARTAVLILVLVFLAGAAGARAELLPTHLR